MTDHPPVSEQITFLYVDDLERSHRYYHDALGLMLILDQGSCRIYRTSTTGYLGVCERPGRVEPGGLIVTLVSPAVDDWHSRLLGAGVEVVHPPRHSEEYRVYHAFYRDPDGHLVEIQEFDDPGWADPAR